MTGALWELAVPSGWGLKKHDEPTKADAETW